MAGISRREHLDYRIDAAAELRRLHAVNAQLEQDAARYRWLRDSQCSYTVIEDGTPNGICGIEFVAQVTSVSGWDGPSKFAKDVDESIDAALASFKEQNHA